MPQHALEIESCGVEGQQTIDGQPFPLVLKCVSRDADLASTVQWIREHAAQLDQQCDSHGTILFRDFPLATDQDFDAFIQAFGYPNFPYNESLSNAVRVNRTERVFTANEAPPDVTIYFHHEMAQTPLYPSKLFFFCELPAERGGATPLCRSDAVFARLQQACPEFAHDCETKGLRYSNVMPSTDDPASGMGRSWQSTYRAATREQAEQRLQAIGYSWQWLPDGCLRATTPVLPAVRPLSGNRKSFFNQLIAAFQGWKDVRNDPSQSITFGDGTPLDPAAVNTATEIAYELAFDVPWQRGDVALVDNYVVMHGRRPFEGSRKILASLVAGE